MAEWGWLTTMARSTSESDGIADGWHNAAEWMAYASQYVGDIQERKQRGVSIGIPKVEDHFEPLLPGELCAVIAQTSQYKSGFLHCIERHVIRQLAAEGRNELVVHVSVEESIEQQAYLELARETGIRYADLVRGNIEDWSGLLAAAVRLSALPLIKIGVSLSRPDHNVRLYLSNIVKIIEHMQTHIAHQGRAIATIFVDYLQALPLDPNIRRQSLGDQRRLQVREDIYTLRDMSMRFDCPIWVAVQAKQHLENNKGDVQMPGVYDGEESSSIAQRADRVIQLWMPKMTHPIGSEISVAGKIMTVAENDLFVRVGKQRGGLPSGRMFHMLIDFQKNEIHAAI